MEFICDYKNDNTITACRNIEKTVVKRVVFDEARSERCVDRSPKSVYLNEEVFIKIEESSLD